MATLYAALVATALAAACAGAGTPAATGQPASPGAVASGGQAESPPQGASAEPPPGAPPSELIVAPARPEPVRIRDEDPPPVTARYIAIVDEDSGALLYGRDQDVPVPPASTTKIATTIVALQREPDLGRVVPITINGPEMAARDGSQIIGLEPGEQLRLETLLYGMMLWSGNDAAEQVAEALGGTRERYVQWMNELCLRLGLKHTHFVNPSGMDADGHYSSAADMAYLARFAMQDPVFRQLAGARTFRAEGYGFTNLNRLLGNYPGADGVKVGFTTQARRTLVASAVREGHRVYVSLMRSEDLVGDATALFEWVWRTFLWEA